MKFSPLFVALVLAGCGGSRSGPGSRGLDAKRALVVRTLTSLDSTCAYQPCGPIRFGLFTWLPTGLDPVEPPDVNDPLASVDGPTPTFYFNDGLGLWEDVPGGDYHREDFYLDEAKTQPAGFCEEDDTGDSAVDIVRYEITAGAFAGARGEMRSEIREGVDEDHDFWRCTYKRVAENGTVYSGEFTWVGLASESTATTIHPDGATETLTVKLDAKDAGTLVFVSREGVTLTARFTESSVGKGSFTGTADGLPASFDLVESDHLKVHFNDGSNAEFGGGRKVSRRTKGKTQVATGAGRWSVRP